MEFMESHWPKGFSKINGIWLGKPESRVSHLDSGPRVTITVKRRSMTYGALHSCREVIDFANSLGEAKEDGIVIDGIEGKDRIMEKAVATDYSNTASSLPAGDTKKAFLAFVLWKIQLYTYERSIDSFRYCLNELHELAPNSFEKARLLLSSQCDREFVPLPMADMDVVRDAIRMLKSEKNGKRVDARNLLRQLYATGHYDAQLGTWNDKDE
jgi:hypothetical protein